MSISSEKDKENKLVRFGAIIGEAAKEKLVKYMEIRKLPFSLLVAIAIEKELEKENPFEYDVNMPEEEYLEYAFMDQASKILQYLKTTSGMSLEQLCNMREDIGVPDKEEFLLAFRECLKKDFIEGYKPAPRPWSTVNYDESFLFFRMKGTGRKAVDKKRKESTEFDKYQKLKKKYEGV